MSSLFKRAYFALHRPASDFDISPGLYAALSISTLLATYWLIQRRLIELCSSSSQLVLQRTIVFALVNLQVYNDPTF